MKDLVSKLQGREKLKETMLTSSFHTMCTHSHICTCSEVWSVLQQATQGPFPKFVWKLMRLFTCQAAKIWSSRASWTCSFLDLQKPVVFRRLIPSVATRLWIFIVLTINLEVDTYRGNCQCLCSSLITKHREESMLNLSITSRLAHMSLAPPHGLGCQHMSPRKLHPEQWHAGTTTQLLPQMGRLGTNLRCLESHTTIALGMEQGPSPDHGWTGPLSLVFHATACFAHEHPRCNRRTGYAFPLVLSLIFTPFLLVTIYWVLSICVFCLM